MAVGENMTRSDCSISKMISCRRALRLVSRTETKPIQLWSININVYKQNRKNEKIKNLTPHQ